MASHARTAFISLSQKSARGNTVLYMFELFPDVPLTSAALSFHNRKYLPEFADEDFILEEPTGKKSLRHEQCIQAKRSEYTWFSLLVK